MGLSLVLFGRRRRRQVVHAKTYQVCTRNLQTILTRMGEGRWLGAGKGGGTVFLLTAEDTCQNISSSDGQNLVTLKWLVMGRVMWIFGGRMISVGPSIKGWRFENDIRHVTDSTPPNLIWFFHTVSVLPFSFSLFHFGNISFSFLLLGSVRDMTLNQALNCALQTLVYFGAWSYW